VNCGCNLWKRISEEKINLFEVMHILACKCVCVYARRWPVEINGKLKILIQESYLLWADSRGPHLLKEMQVKTKMELLRMNKNKFVTKGRCTECSFRPYVIDNRKALTGIASLIKEISGNRSYTFH
jgi:hypothetical protein